MNEKHPYRIVNLWIKWVCTVILIVWAYVYWGYYGLENFLWFCDLANFIIVIALWIESPLLASSQGVSILLLQTLWALDVSSRLIFGFHPIGGTEYMFNPDVPLMIRLFSLFHIITPVLVIWTIKKLGYDKRGWIVQTQIAWVILPLCFFFTGPDKDINWVWGLFGRKQDVLNPFIYLSLLMAGYPLLIYLPTHLILKHLFSSKREDTGLKSKRL